MLAITPTKLNDYQLCPQKFKLKHVDKAAESNSSSAPLAFGITMHAVMQELYQSKSKLIDLDTHELLKKHWSSEAYSDHEENAHYLARGFNALETYCSVFPAEPIEEILGTEVYMSSVVRFGNLRVRFGCKADRVSLYRNELLEILDYKTNASGKVPTLDFLSKDLATFVYYVLGRITYPQHKNLQITFLNLITLAQASVTYTPDQLAANKKALFEVLTAISGENFAAVPSEACSWCQFSDNCYAANKIVDFSAID